MLSIVFSLIGVAKRQRELAGSCWGTPKGPQQIELGQAKSRSQELNLDPPRRVTGTQRIKA